MDWTRKVKPVTLVGAVLAVYDVAKSADSLSLGINVNLIWGAVLLVFGVLMIFGTIRVGKSEPK